MNGEWYAYAYAYAWGLQEMLQALLTSPVDGGRRLHMSKLGEEDFESGRASNWRESLDGSGLPTHAPERATSGCHHCGGPLDALQGIGQYECPWCIARYPDEDDEDEVLLKYACCSVPAKENTHPPPLDGDTCPLCRSVLESGFGLAGGGCGTYWMCGGECPYFYKIQEPA